jgi:sulfite oxidase
MKKKISDFRHIFLSYYMKKKRINRKEFITKTGLTIAAAIIGSKVVFAENLPKDLEPIETEENSFDEIVPGKDKNLIILNNKPWNAETY